MKPDEFEQELEKQRLRPVPPAWRAGILEAARNAAGSQISHPSNHARVSWWRELFWPCPQAWAGLAVVWLVIFTLHLTKPAEGPSFAGPSIMPPLDQPTQLSTQRAELVRLLENAPESAPSRSLPRALPGPRSERPSPPRA